jgi:hypothetical protein
MGQQRRYYVWSSQAGPANKKLSAIPELFNDVMRRYRSDIKRLPPLLRHETGFNWLFFRHVAKRSRKGMPISRRVRRHSTIA